VLPTTISRLAVVAVCVLAVTACDSKVDGSAVPDVGQAGTTAPVKPTTPTSSSGGPAGRFTPSEDNPDPSVNIRGVERQDYKPGLHVQSPQRVAYDQSPPYGGAHDAVWATCTGVVYPKAVRTEHLVHSLEHGAVWIAYNPDQVQGADLQALQRRVSDQPYMVMSPYPGLDKPVSLQSWGRRLKVDTVTDERIDQFVQALRRNKNTYPEPGAPCDSSGFDQDNPPPFDPSPAPPGSMSPTGG
jgi:uncharacterized protein DUF3105